MRNFSILKGRKKVFLKFSPFERKSAGLGVSRLAKNEKKWKMNRIDAGNFSRRFVGVFKRPNAVATERGALAVFAPVGERIRSNGRSAPVGERIRSNGRSAPVGERVRLNGRSAPVGERIRSNGRSAPVGERIRLNGRSAPVGERVRPSSGWRPSRKSVASNGKFFDVESKTIVTIGKYEKDK